MTASRYRTRKQRLFRSVFQTDISQPTPRATPVAPFTEPGAPFGSPHVVGAQLGVVGQDGHQGGQGGQGGAFSSSPPGPLAPPPIPPPHQRHHANDQVRWDRAWHVVTSRIQLPSSVAIEVSFGSLAAVGAGATVAPHSQPVDRSSSSSASGSAGAGGISDEDVNFGNSLALVLNPGTALPQASQVEDILLWHAQQARHHFIHHVRPLLSACAGQGGHAQVLLASISTLEAAHRQYHYGLSLIVRGFHDDAAAAIAVTKFRRDLHAVIGNSLTPGLTTALRSVLRGLLRIILGLGQRHDAAGDIVSTGTASAGAVRRPSSSPPLPLPLPHEDERAARARNDLLNLLESMQNVGLAGDKFQILFAEIMDASMAEFIQTSYAGVWRTADPSSNPASSTHAECLSHLSDWVENHYGRLAVEVFGRLGTNVAWNDVECWQDIAVGRLAKLRIQELFDIALAWPDSMGGVEDLRSAVATPQRRLQLTDAFSQALQKRLLHPGRSTLEILQTYMSMIRTFHALDPSEVLLDRVVHALQLYLCQRDDAIRIVVTGLLSNPQGTDPEEAKTKLVELAILLNTASLQKRRPTDDEDLDWDDMSWVPDPIDAGVNYKRPKTEDVIGTLINALGSQDIFIKEFQLIIAERLLSHQTTFVQETKVLSLLKKRFGEGALQNCDVMMKDIQDSKRVDALLNKNLHGTAAAGPEPPGYHAKILSRLFWPSLEKEPFKVPPPVADIQSRYEQGFEGLKSSRKLSWLDNLGTATVKLDFEDRPPLEVECKAYEAAVIYEFQNEDDDVTTANAPQQRTFDELWQKLMIDEDLLALALRFWVSKRVLRDAGNQTYVVLDRLDDSATDQAGDGEDDSNMAGAEDGGEPESPRKAKNMDAQERERRVVYWQFIVGMLTNSAPAMPLGQIAMMMKMLIADGCKWSNEELQEFLGEKVAENELEQVGGKYRLPKK